MTIRYSRIQQCWRRRGEVAVFGFVLITLLNLAGIGSAAAKDKAETISSGARLGGDLQRTRFVVDLSQKVPFKIKMLSAPYRVIVDLPSVKFLMPAKLGKKGRGLVTSFRLGSFAPGKSRIVVDVSRPYLLENPRILKPAGGKPARLVIDIVPTDDQNFRRVQKMLQKKYAAKRKKQKKSKPDIDAIARLAEKSSGRTGKPVVVIDPGHGGIDSGAISVGGVEEKEIVLDFSKMLAERLKKTGKFDVHMTRSDDTFIELKRRVEIAREKVSDGEGLLISIHCDSLPKRRAKGVRGATVYTLSDKASDEEAKALEARENDADILAGVEMVDRPKDVRGILISLGQRMTTDDSIDFAYMLLGNMKGKGRLNRKPHRKANLRVLRAPDVPSVLLELGYLSSKQDEQLLKSKKWQGKIAGSIVKSVDRYFANQVAERQ